jgi:hypothetical protein
LIAHSPSWSLVRQRFSNGNAGNSASLDEPAGTPVNLAYLLRLSAATAAERQGTRFAFIALND